MLALVIALAGVSFGQQITQGAFKTFNVKLTTGQAAGATYTWAVTPASGTSTNLSVITGTSAAVLWDGPPGNYSLAVQVTDGNGCLSETIAQNIEIVAPGNLLFAAAFPSTITCSDLAGGSEGSVPGHSSSTFKVAYDGMANLQSANITIKNPAGMFIGLNGTELANQAAPEITVNNTGADKEIEFSITDSWENNSAGSVIFEVTLISAVTTDLATIVATTTGDVTRTITVLPKPVIGFE